jgi:hypothetical protein
VNSYYAEIGGDFKGIQGDISGGVINQGKRTSNAIAV